MTDTKRQAVNRCKKNRDAEQPLRVVHLALEVPKREIPAEALPLTGQQVLSMRHDPPQWLVEARQRRQERIAKRAERRAARERTWTLQDLEAEYAFELLKDGVPEQQALRRAREQARAARDTIGIQAAGELCKRGGVARAQHIADSAERRSTD